MADPTPTTPAAGTGGATPPLAPTTCSECGATAIAFICSEPGCPVNGGAAYLHSPVPDAPHRTAAPELPAGGAGLPTVEEMAEVLFATDGTPHNGGASWTDWLFYVAEHPILQPAVDAHRARAAAILARLAERRPAAGVEPAPGRVDLGAVRAAFQRALDASFACGEHRIEGNSDDDEEWQSLTREADVAERAFHRALDAALDQVQVGAVREAARVILDHAGKLRPGASTSIPDTMLAALDAALHRAGDGWRPIGDARKDRTSYLLKLKNPIPRPGRDDLRRWDGLSFVGRHPGLADDGFDLGWQFAAPVGQGGFPDEWFEGFRDLPPSTSTGAAP